MVNVIFYEDPNPKDCNVIAVFKDKIKAMDYLQENDWHFNTEYCAWYHKDFRGFVEILEKELM